jgi:hypothetical protein
MTLASWGALIAGGLLIEAYSSRDRRHGSLNAGRGEAVSLIADESFNGILQRRVALQLMLSED